MKKTLLLSLLVASTLQSSEFTSLTTQGLSLTPNLGGLSDVFSIPGLSLPAINCDNSLDVSYLSNLGRICNGVSKLSKTGSFSVGPCVVNGSVGQCAAKSVESYCKSITSNVLHGSPEGDKALLSPANAISMSTANTIITGGDIVMSGMNEDCSKRTKKLYDSVEYGVGVSQRNIDNATVMKNMQGVPVFSRGVEDARDCIKLNAAGGKGLAMSKQKCINGSGITLPKTKSDANKAIAETATMHLASPDKGVASQMAATEKAIGNKLANCSSSTDYEACKKIQLLSSSSTNTKKTSETLIASTELTNARQLKVMEDATRGENLIVYHDDESIGDLPIGIKAEYGSASKRQLAFVTSYRYLMSENSGLSREIIKISIRKSEEAAKPFFENKALEKIKSIIK